MRIRLSRFAFRLHTLVKEPMSNASASLLLRILCRRVVIAMICSFSLASCGGGDSSQSAASKPVPGLSLLAGMIGGPGNIDGPTGRFLSPTGVAVDKAGNLY